MFVNKRFILKKLKIPTEKRLTYTEIYRFISETMKLCLNQYRTLFAICSNEPHEEAIHDFRVAIRKLISQTDLAYRIFPSPYIIEIRSVIKKQLKMFSPLRDIQVQIITVNKLRKTLSELNFFYYDLIAKEHELLLKQKSIIGDMDIDSFDALLFFYLLDLKKFMSFNKTDERSILDLIDIKYRNVIEAKEKLDLQNLDTFHHFRIAFKKFRYTLESSIELLNLDKKISKSLNKYQTMLGDIQDSLVLTENFDNFVKVQKYTSPESFLKAKEYLENQKNHYVEVFLSEIDKVNNFWMREGI